MRGIRFAMLLALPFIVGALYCGVNLFYFGKDHFLVAFIAFLAASLAIFFAKEEINFWYDKKFPPRLDPPIISWLQNFFPFYQTLEKDDRVKFETRLALYLNARSFQLMLKEKKSIPEDIKAIIAAHAIQMSLGLDDYLIGDYDRIICYNHPFPTPGNKFLHTVEVHHDDGVILLSIEQLMLAIRAPKENFNLAYFAYAQCLLKIYPQLASISPLPEDDVLPYDMEHISHITGFPEPDSSAISLSMFFIAPEKLAETHPETYAEYKSILNYAY